MRSRTSVHLQKNLDRNAEVICAMKGISKTEYIEKLIEEDLKKRRIDPTQPPDVNFPEISAKADLQTDTVR
jgi:hypothetical protein